MCCCRLCMTKRIHRCRSNEKNDFVNYRTTVATNFVLSALASRRAFRTRLSTAATQLPASHDLLENLYLPQAANWKASVRGLNHASRASSVLNHDDYTRVLVE